MQWSCRLAYRLTLLEGRSKADAIALVIQEMDEMLERLKYPGSAYDLFYGQIIDDLNARPPFPPVPHSDENRTVEQEGPEDRKFEDETPEPTPEERGPDDEQGKGGQDQEDGVDDSEFLLNLHQKGH